MTGKQIRSLKVGWQVAGNYQGKDRVTYQDGRNNLGDPVASSVYFYTIQAGDFSDTRKMFLMKLTYLIVVLFCLFSEVDENRQVRILDQT